MTHTDKLDKIYTEISESIKNAVDKFGEKSTYSSKKVIKIKDKKLQFDIGRSGYVLMEVGEHDLIGNSGYEFGFNYLDIFELAEISDYINKLVSEK